MKWLDRMPRMLDECCGHAASALTRRGLLKSGVAATLLGGATILEPRQSAAHSDRPEGGRESLIPAAAGGSTAHRRDEITLRWLGTACFELVYRDRVYLLDAFYDERGPRTRPIGLTPEQVIRADAIFIGHAHYDHIADAASAAIRTGAPVIGDQLVSVPLLQSQGLPPQQTHGVSGLGGERLDFDGFTVEPILAHHSVAIAGVDAKGDSLYQNILDAYTAVGPAITPAELGLIGSETSRGSNDLRILAQGTIAYLFTFDTGYRLLWLDSAGPITAQLQDAMQRVGSTNVAIVGYQGNGFAHFEVPVTLPLVQLFKPDLFLPNHHDQFIVGMKTVVPDIATEPLFLAIRDMLPNTQCESPLYRTPVCINIRTGEIRKGRR